MTEEQERLEFEDMMQRHAAPLTEYLGRYVARLSKADREWFTREALDIAWDRRSKLDPRRKSILGWWEDTLRIVALRRPTWQVVMTTGWESIAGKRLGR